MFTADPGCSAGALAEATVTIPRPLGKVDLPQLMGRVIKSALGFAGIVALLMFIYGGFTYMTAAGESEKIEKGKNAVIWATIGLIALFSSYFIADFIIKLVQK